MTIIETTVPLGENVGTVAIASKTSDASKFNADIYVKRMRKKLLLAMFVGMIRAIIVLVWDSRMSTSSLRHSWSFLRHSWSSIIEVTEDSDPPTSFHVIGFQSVFLFKSDSRLSHFFAQALFTSIVLSRTLP
jgi:hypothetical protein